MKRTPQKKNGKTAGALIASPARNASALHARSQVKDATIPRTWRTRRPALQKRPPWIKNRSPTPTTFFPGNNLHLPKTAYISLWFPLPSETFIFREVQNLKRAGMPISVYTLYGLKAKRFSPEMREAVGDVRRMGLKSIPKILRDLRWWRKRDPETVKALWKEVPFRRWSCLELAGENAWAFLGGFHLARRILEDGMEHIHAVWGNGPATAAWVASRLTGLPFSFSGRAGDIHPQDGALPEKIRAAAFVHTNNKANIPHLAGLVPDLPDARDKIFQIYNCLTLKECADAHLLMKPPYRLLAVGRFCRTKGFEDLLRACRLLDQRGFPFQLTLVGAGFLGAKLRRMTKRFGLTPRVFLPGFVTHDRITELLVGSDMFIMPSVIDKTGDRDGIPNVIMEAFTHRLPVIATNISGIPEVVRNGETGLLVPERDPEALADAVQRTAAEPEAARAMAERGRALVARLFDSEANTKKMYDLFVERAGKHPDGRSA